MQPYEVKIVVPHEVLLNLHKSPDEAAEDIRRQAAIRYYKKRVLSLNWFFCVDNKLCGG